MKQEYGRRDITRMITQGDNQNGDTDKIVGNPINKSIFMKIRRKFPAGDTSGLKQIMHTARHDSRPQFDVLFKLLYVLHDELKIDLRLDLLRGVHLAVVTTQRFSASCAQPPACTPQVHQSSICYR